MSFEEMIELAPGDPVVPAKAMDEHGKLLERLIHPPDQGEMFSLAVHELTHGR
jgi:hypothetical protein